jgi:hypothetical protein
MKKILSSALVVFLISNSICFAEAIESKEFEAKNSSVEYNDQFNKIAQIIQDTDGTLTAANEEDAKILPKDTSEAHAFFTRFCSTDATEADLSRKVTITNDNSLTKSEFLCDVQTGKSSIETLQFIATVDGEDKLKDLQVSHLRAKTLKTLPSLTAISGDARNFDFRDGAEVVIAIAASTLVSGVLAKQMYPGEKDKITHAVAGSLIAASASLISYYGLKLTKNQAAIVGFVAAVAAGLLKEYVYDARDPLHHTVDGRDAFATGMGGAFGSFFIRLKFRF